MNTLTPNSQGNIYTIIDNKWYIVPLANCVKFFSNSDLLSRIGCLLTILHNGDSSLQSCLDDLANIIGTQDSWSLISDEVE